MLLRIIGIVWIVFGILGLINPEIIKGFLKWRLTAAKRKILFLIIIIMAGLFFYAARYAHGVRLQILLIFGIIALVKAIFTISAKTYTSVVEWWLKKPMWVWKAWSVSLIVLGSFLYFLK